jgi:MFS family permease
MSAPWRFLREQAGFRRLWLATAVSELGASIARIAFILVVHQRAVASGSNSPEAANALMLILETAPMVLFGPIAGALVDRCDRRRLLVASILLQAALIVSVPFLMRLACDWPLYAVAMCVAAVSTVFPPARQSAVPDLVGIERASTANSISGSTTSLPLDLPRHLATTTGGFKRFLADAFEGVRFARRDPAIAYITTCFLMAFVFIGIWMPLVPEYLRRDIGVDADTWMPYSWMAFGLGGIVGGALGGLVGRTFGMGRTIVLIYFAEPFQMMAYFWVTSAPAMVCLSFTWGVIAFAYFVQEQTVLHEDVPAELRGRVFGLLPPLQALGTLIASGIVFFEAGLLAPRVMLLLAGSSYLVMSIVFTLSMRGSRLLWARPRSGA